jgi:hypothetical protein
MNKVLFGDILGCDPNPRCSARCRNRYFSVRLPGGSWSFPLLSNDYQESWGAASAYHGAVYLLAFLIPRHRGQPFRGVSSFRSKIDSGTDWFRMTYLRLEVDTTYMRRHTSAKKIPHPSQEHIKHHALDPSTSTGMGREERWMCLELNSFK